MALPGWGSWGGKAVKQKPGIKRSFVRVVKQGVDEDKRKDKQLNHVIINEKTSKKVRPLFLPN